MFKFTLVFLCIVFINSKDIYMATTGSDSNDGTIKKPYKTIMKCQEAASYGDTVYIRKGTYKNFSIAKQVGSYNYVFYFSKSGITYKNYNNEKVIFDFSDGN